MKVKILSLDELPAGLSSALAYWRELGGDKLQCSWKTFDLMKIPSSLLPTTMVIDVGVDMDANRYRYWGSVMTRLHGRDMTNLCPYDIPPEKLAERIRQDHAMMLREKKAYARIYGFERHGGFEHFHSVLALPLSDDAENVHQIAVVIELTAKGSNQLRDRPNDGAAFA